MTIYPAQITQAYKVVLVLVFPPLLLVPLGVFLMAEYANMPDWLVITFIVLLMALTIGIVLYLIKKIAPKANYCIDGDMHYVEVLTKSFLVPSSFHFKTEDIHNFWADEHEGRVYFTIEKTGSPGKFSVNAASKSEEHARIFADLIMAVDRAVTRQNSKGDKPTIVSKTMYETWWAKALVVFGVVVLAGAFVVAIVFPDKDIEWWRFVALLAFLIPWAIKVYLHNKKEEP